jgi:hypothetical protein
MSLIQKQVKPTLEEMVSGKPVKLKPPAQALVAAWTTMFVMVVDHLFRGSTIVPHQEHQHFMAARIPPPNWQIWIGRYKGKRWAAHAVRNLVPFVREEDFPDGELNVSTAYNTHETTFMVGELYVRVFASVIPSVSQQWVIPQGAEHLFVRLWPMERHTIRWPCAELLSDAEAEFVANWTYNLSRRRTGV